MGQVYRATDTKAAITEGLVRHRVTLHIFLGECRV